MIETIIIVAGASLSAIVLGSLALTNAILKREDKALDKETASEEDYGLWKDLTKRAQDLVSGLEKESNHKTRDIFVEAITTKKTYPLVDKAKKLKVIAEKRKLLERTRASHESIATDFYEDDLRRKAALKEVARIDAELLKLVEEENS